MNRFEEGTALAVEILCKIFFTCRLSVFHDKYVACFIKATQAVLCYSVI